MDRGLHGSTRRIKICVVLARDLTDSLRTATNLVDARSAPTPPSSRSAVRRYYGVGSDAACPSCAPSERRGGQAESSGLATERSDREAGSKASERSERGRKALYGSEHRAQGPPQTI